MLPPPSVRIPARSSRHAAPLVCVLLLVAIALVSAPHGTSVALAQTSPPVSVKIDFTCQSGQDSACVAPRGRVAPGFLPDVGLAYGDRGNGYSYGWVTPGTTMP